MNTTDFPNPDSILAELATLGLRTGRGAARMMEIEGEAAEAVACWLATPRVRLRRRWRRRR